MLIVYLYQFWPDYGSLNEIGDAKKDTPTKMKNDGENLSFDVCVCVCCAPGCVVRKLSSFSYIEG